MIVQSDVGVIDTGSAKQQAEHGGFAQDDTNGMLLVENPRVQTRMVTSCVETPQVAPTMLKAQGYEPIVSAHALQRTVTAPNASSKQEVG
jgi:hypothetical protein